MTGIKWKRMLAALCCAFIAISGGCANPSTSSGSSVSQESGIPASQETSETQAPSQMAESAYEPSAPSSSVPESQSKPPESGRPSVAWSSIDDILAGMSLRDKICQMLVLSPELLTGVSGVTAAGETTRQALVDMPVGGLIYSRPNLKSRQQVCKMLSNTQSYSKIPLILTCDEEGGRVNRLMSTVGTTYIGPMFGYRDQGAETARQNAHTIASDMRVLGFNADLAPVADVWSNPDNTVIGDRAYSDDFAQAAELIPEAVRGFHSGGVATTLKHFPGHGDALADSHDGAVYVSKPLEQLRREELLPFRAGDCLRQRYGDDRAFDPDRNRRRPARAVFLPHRHGAAQGGAGLSGSGHYRRAADEGADRLLYQRGNRPPCGVGRSRYPALPVQTRRRPSPLWRKRSRWEKSAKSGSTKVCAGSLP